MVTVELCFAIGLNFDNYDGDLSIIDPCACGDPQNVWDASGLIDLFHDVVTIEDFTLNPIKNWKLFRDGAGNITAGDMLDINGIPIPGNTVLPQVALNIFQIDLWHQPGIGFEALFYNDVNDNGIFDIGEENISTGGTCNNAIITLTMDRVCQGNALYIASGGAVLPIGDNAIYQWYKIEGAGADNIVGINETDDVLVETIIGNPYYSPTEDGNYRVTVTLDNGNCGNSPALNGFPVLEIINCKDCPK